jgi:rhombotail lipoprotein
MRRSSLVVTSLFVLLSAGCGASMPPTRRTSSALDFLYPGGTATAQSGAAVELHVPVRVGLAFAPGRDLVQDPITEADKQRLLSRVADAFKEHPGLGRIEPVPSAYLRAGGSFENLDQLKSSLGLDLMVLVSYDQAQFTESTRASWTYLTVIGPLLIEGEKNDTRTLVDAVIYDIPSRNLLFRAAGESTVNARSSPLNVETKRRTLAQQGFAKATDDLIAKLSTALTSFEEQAKQGSVSGPGTPAIAMYDKSGARIGKDGAGRSGGGVVGLVELAALALLGLAVVLRRS